jgi:hypothetical protein
VLDALYIYKLLVNKDKSEFYIKKTVFLGFEISLGKVRIEPTKVDAIRTWPRPRNTMEVQGFIGFANFYRMFIKNFGDIVRLLHYLTKKGIEFHWDEKYEQAF